MPSRPTTPPVAIVGAGPAGLMAAEVLGRHRVPVAVFDSMRSAGRKFLLAGKGGMNITHAEPFERFCTRYAARRGQIEPMLAEFGPAELRAWVEGLGIQTFVGSSGRVFPKEMKAAPLLRAWLHRLRGAGAVFHMRHRWLGWTEAGDLRFATPQGEQVVQTRAVILALGGGSWARLGSDGAWVPLLQQRGIEVAPLRPANCGFERPWSAHFRERYAGAPVKPVVARTRNAGGETIQQQGEFVVTATGVEGGLIYALSAVLRDGIEAQGSTILELDLAPDRDAQRLAAALARPRGGRSLANHLRREAGIAGVKAGLLRETLRPEELAEPARLAAAIKSLPLRLHAARPLDEAISSAGGVRFETLDERLMARALPGVFCAGEMLDWEAPTGGYLLTACLASGRVAGQGVLDWLRT